MTTGDRGRLVAKLDEIASLSERLVVGLSSGTSFDGIDAALVRVAGLGPDLRAELISFVCVPFDPSLRSRIAAAPAAWPCEIARLNFDIGEAFAEAALSLIRGAGRTPADIHLVGSHGQTIWHDPPRDGRSGATLQIGEGDVIALRTGVVTVSDFRTADVAVGGSGAPLIPLVDWLLFKKPGEARLMLNIGGIANVTYLAEDLSQVRAFDTGPGNALMDEIVRAATAGRETMDWDGARADRGRPSEEAVRGFLSSTPYFARVPPKSTGREMFGAEAGRGLSRALHGPRAIERLTRQELSDLLATATAVTARSVRDAVGFLPTCPPVARVIVSGGGVWNRPLMRMLSELFAPCPVVSLAEHGMDPDAKEAVGFAVLANEALGGAPGNLPAVTGAKKPVVLGKLSAGF
jgi:anhydro-N-acetylmuramic acid kinase